MRGFSIDVSPEVEAFHRDAFVFDLHNVLLTKLTHFPHDIAKRNGTATFWNPLRLDLDLPRIRQGGIAALGCMLFSGFRFDSGRRRFWRQLDCARELARAHADALVLGRSRGVVRAARDSGRVAFVLGVEGCYAIDDDAEGG